MTPWWKKVYYWFYRKTSDLRFFVFREFPCYFHRAKKGYSYIDTWSFDAYLCGVITGGLKELKNRHIGYPASLSKEEWDEILGKIIDGFIAGKALIDMDYMEDSCRREDWEPKEEAFKEKFEEGMNLFREYFFHLWD